MRAVETGSVADIIFALEDKAVRDHGVPEEVAREARIATMKFVGDRIPADVAPTVRIRSYFWAVVRRACNRRPDARDVSARFVLAAALQDLRAVETRPEEMWDRLRRDWTGRVPEHVLDEFGRRLCA